MANDIKFLKIHPQLQSVNKKSLLWIRKHKQLVKYNRNQVLYKEGEPAKYVYIIESG